MGAALHKKHLPVLSISSSTILKCTDMFNDVTKCLVEMIFGVVFQGKVLRFLYEDHVALCFSQ